MIVVRFRLGVFTNFGCLERKRCSFLANKSLKQMKQDLHSWANWATLGGIGGIGKSLSYKEAGLNSCWLSELSSSSEEDFEEADRVGEDAFEFAELCLPVESALESALDLILEYCSVSGGQKMLRWSHSVRTQVVESFKDSAVQWWNEALVYNRALQIFF